MEDYILLPLREEFWEGNKDDLILSLMLEIEPCAGQMGSLTWATSPAP